MSMKRLASCGLHAGSSTYFSTFLAQDRVVTGKVTDSKDGTPLSVHLFNQKAPRPELQLPQMVVFILLFRRVSNTLVISSAEFESRK